MVKPPRLNAFDLSASLEGQTVGLRELEDARWLVTFAAHDLGAYDENTRRFTPMSGKENEKKLIARKNRKQTRTPTEAA
jgi:hypothetical protein